MLAMGRKAPYTTGSTLLWCGLALLLLQALQGVQCEHEPTESECRPYIEKALKEHHVDDIIEDDASPIEQEENSPIDERTESNEQASDENKTAEEDGATTEDSTEGGDETDNTAEDTGESVESQVGEEENKTENDNDNLNKETEESTDENITAEDQTAAESESTENDLQGQDEGESDEKNDSTEGTQEETSGENYGVSVEGDTAEVETEAETAGQTESQERDDLQNEESGESAETGTETDEAAASQTEGLSSESVEAKNEEQSAEATEEPSESKEESEERPTDESPGSIEEAQDTKESEGDNVSVEGEIETSKESVEDGATQETVEEDPDSTPSQEDTLSSEVPSEDTPSQEESTEIPSKEESDDAPSKEESEDAPSKKESGEAPSKEDDATSTEGSDGEQSQEQVDSTPSQETEGDSPSQEIEGESPSAEDATLSQETAKEGTSKEALSDDNSTAQSSDETVESDQPAEDVSSEEAQQEPVEELTREAIIPANLRPREHITQILKLDEDSVEKESVLAKTIDNTLNTLKKLYDNAIKPLEILYKYRDLSNRHFGDPEIFSKPLILFMGPWSGGKSSTINYLLDLEFTELALRTGAEPSPAYFNILTYGEETEILDGTQLAADWTFSGLQKFGQGMLDRLRGVKLKSRLLEKVNIVEIPGILEIRKQVQRLFPFNDACQWFIDRADIIFLVYDPAKLDVGPETEAILDQLKGREYQTRIVLNKADQVKPEELMRVQGTLIWNISPLMSSQEPPVMYTTSLWSLPYETNAPTRLLIAQERAFLRDLREAIDKRVENKIASARRFAVRVRNHAKMVDCYLTTYYNHKTFFGNKKKIADDITETPQKYHIYEGLSTLTNISRYDLPDPEMYRDFFRINNLYDFTKLSDTCTYFRGCPINKLDIAIAYDLPELVGKYKKSVELAKTKS